MKTNCTSSLLRYYHVNCLFDVVRFKVIWVAILTFLSGLYSNALMASINARNIDRIAQRSTLNAFNIDMPSIESIETRRNNNAINDIGSKVS